MKCFTKKYEKLNFKTENNKLKEFRDEFTNSFSKTLGLSFWSQFLSNEKVLFETRRQNGFGTLSKYVIQVISKWSESGSRFDACLDLSCLILVDFNQVLF